MTAYVSSRGFQEFEILTTSDVVVPVDFVGQHIAYPVSGTQPTYSFGSVRSHDSAPKMAWRQIQPSSGGAFDWSGNDTWVDYWIGQGKTIRWTLEGCPTWAAQVAWQGTADPYGALGGGSPPNVWADWTTFVSTLATRYLGKIRTYEIVNEPHYAGGSHFFGTAAELAEMHWRARTTILAIDPTAKIYSSGMDGALNNYARTFLRGVDPTSSKKGYETIDAFNLHIYHGSVTKSLTTDIDNAIDTMKLQLAAVGVPNMPFAITEWGISGAIDAEVTAWLALTAAQRKTGLMRRMMIGAARGAQNFFCYSHSATHGGNFQTDTDGVISAMTDIHNQVAGKTISDAVLAKNSGAVTLTFTNGTVLTV